MANDPKAKRKVAKRKVAKEQKARRKTNMPKKKVKNGVATLNKIR